VAYTGNRPDINKDTDTRSGAVNGAGSDQSNITLDGVDVNADTKGYIKLLLSPTCCPSVRLLKVGKKRIEPFCHRRVREPN
jgi:hypothetical protein